MKQVKTVSLNGIIGKRVVYTPICPGYGENGKQLVGQTAKIVKVQAGNVFVLRFSTGEQLVCNPEDVTARG